MANSINYQTKRDGTPDSQISHGHIHNDEVKSSLMLQGQESLEYISIDQTEPRKRWITSRCRGRYQVKSGDDIPKGQPGMYFDACNGDIIFRTGGRIRIEAENVDIISRGGDSSNGTINLISNESINLKSKKITVSATESLSLFTDGEMFQAAINILKVYSGASQRLTASSSLKAPSIPIIPDLLQYSFISGK
jgi:hypothetical protein